MELLLLELPVSQSMYSPPSFMYNSLSLNRSGSLFAYSIHQSGSDWQSIRFKDVSTGEVLPDELHWVKFSGIAWSGDEKGIFYSRYPTPKTFSEVDKAANKSKGTTTGYPPLYILLFSSIPYRSIYLNLYV